MENWKPIFGYNDKYYVSDLGRVVSLHGKKPCILKQTLLQDGTMAIGSLYKNGELVSCNKRVHVLVAEEFVPNEHNECYVTHINGDKTDNRSCNLKWGKSMGSIKLSKLTPQDVISVKDTYVAYSEDFGIPALAKKYKVSKSCIHRALKKR